MLRGQIRGRRFTTTIWQVPSFPDPDLTFRVHCSGSRVPTLMRMRLLGMCGAAHRAASRGRARGQHGAQFAGINRLPGARRLGPPRFRLRRGARIASCAAFPVEIPGAGVERADGPEARRVAQKPSPPLRPDQGAATPGGAPANRESAERAEFLITQARRIRRGRQNSGSRSTL
jgi:hypothetical protein